MTFASEAQMQQMVGDLLRNGGFAEAVSGADRIHQLAKSAPNILPIFAIDRVARAAMMAAASGALKDIHDLAVLTDDANISMQRGETLRPDFICMSASTNAVFLIELKKSHQTAREAITELVGYEHEVKNYLPFLADFDLNFVLISAEWSTLLDHGAASACCWSGKKLLCLEAGLDNGALTLKPRIPEAWTITGATEFPRESLQTFQVTLEGRAADDEGDPDPRLYTALDLLARSGDRGGSHGFAMLWRDRAAAEGTFHLTVGGVAPVAFFDAASESGMIRLDQGHLAAAVAQAFEGAPRTAPDSLFELFRGIKPFLKEIAPVTAEGLFSWDAARETYLYRAEPLAFEFWGLLGDHARSFLMKPSGSFRA